MESALVRALVREWVKALVQGLGSELALVQGLGLVLEPALALVPAREPELALQPAPCGGRPPGPAQ